MSEVIKVETREIVVAGLKLSCYRLPSGEYRASLSQFAKALGVETTNVKRSLKGVSLEVKALSGKGFKGVTETILLTPEQMTTVVGSFAGNGNKVALSYLIATSTETLIRRADAVFGIKKKESDYEEETKKLYLRLRQQARVTFRPKFTDWLKSDHNGDSSEVNFPKEVRRLKAAGNIPIGRGVDEMSLDELMKWSEAESRYDAMRIAGLSHNEALLTMKASDLTQIPTFDFE